jgi:hypothetical protein
MGGRIVEVTPGSDSFRQLPAEDLALLQSFPEVVTADAGWSLHTEATPGDEMQLESP